MRRVLTLLVAVAALLTAFTSIVSAQKVVSQGTAVTETFTIVAIDSQNRLVTLKDKDGFVELIYAGPEVQRFDALKVGDKVTFRYHESIVYAIQKPGATPPAASAGGIATVRNPGSKPGATLSQQMTATVTVQTINLKIPSVTITMDDGSWASFKVENKKNLDGVKAGDRVQITYTQALAISVETPGK